MFVTKSVFGGAFRIAQVSFLLTLNLVLAQQLTAQDNSINKVQGTQKESSSDSPDGKLEVLTAKFSHMRLKGEVLNGAFYSEIEVPQQYTYDVSVQVPFQSKDGVSYRTSKETRTGTRMVIEIKSEMKDVPLAEARIYLGSGKQLSATEYKELYGENLVPVILVEDAPLFLKSFGNAINADTLVLENQPKFSKHFATWDPTQPMTFRLPGQFNAHFKDRVLSDTREERYSVTVPYTEQVTQTYTVMVPQQVSVNKAYTAKIPTGEERVVDDQGRPRWKTKFDLEQRQRTVLITRMVPQNQTRAVNVQRSREEQRTRQRVNVELASGRTVSIDQMRKLHPTGTVNLVDFEIGHVNELQTLADLLRPNTPIQRSGRLNSTAQYDRINSGAQPPTEPIPMPKANSLERPPAPPVVANDDDA